MCDLFDRTAKLNITHLDIKTHNIVVSINEQNDLTKIKIIDWDASGCMPISADEQSAFAWLMKAQLALLMLFLYKVNPFYQKLNDPPANTKLMFHKKQKIKYKHRDVSVAEQLKWYMCPVYDEFVQFLTEQDRADKYELHFLTMFVDKKTRADVSKFLLTMIKKDHEEYIDVMNKANKSISEGNNGINELELALQMVDNERSLNFLYESKNEDIWDATKGVMASIDQRGHRSQSIELLSQLIELLLEISFAICHPDINMRCVYQSDEAARILGAEVVSDLLENILAKWKIRKRNHEHVTACIGKFDYKYPRKKQKIL
jgi:serine/threonine protein kinase